MPCMCTRTRGNPFRRRTLDARARALTILKSTSGKLKLSLSPSPSLSLRPWCSIYTRPKRERERVGQSSEEGNGASTSSERAKNGTSRNARASSQENTVCSALSHMHTRVQGAYIRVGLERQSCTVSFTITATQRERERESIHIRAAAAFVTGHPPPPANHGLYARLINSC